MALFQKVLVAYDGSSYSKKALAKAKEIIELDQGVEVHIVTVTEPHHVNMYGYNLNKDYMSKIEAKNTKLLEEARGLMEPIDEVCHTKNLEGNVSYEIIDYSQGQNIDLIVLGSHGNGGLKDVLLGGVSQKVMRHAKCHVLIVR